MAPSTIVKLAYIFGVLAAALALYLLLRPYSVITYYSGPLRPGNFTVEGVLLIHINNTSDRAVRVPAIVGESIYGVSVAENITLSAPPRGSALYNFTFAKYLYIPNSTEQVNITIQSIKIPLINKILTVLMVVFFILMFAFLVIGYLFQITYKIGNTGGAIKENS